MFALSSAQPDAPPDEDDDELDELVTFTNMTLFICLASGACQAVYAHTRSLKWDEIGNG